MLVLDRVPMDVLSQCFNSTSEHSPSTISATPRLFVVRDFRVLLHQCRLCAEQSTDKFLVCVITGNLIVAAPLGVGPEEIQRDANPIRCIGRMYVKQRFVAGKRDITKSGR